jgi:homoserine dehydrogenase
MECDVKPVRLAILGLGTVGGGALKLLQENAAEIKRRTGREIQITHVGTAVHVQIYNSKALNKAQISWRSCVNLMLM